MANETCVRTFNSLNSFYNYICTTQINEAYEHRELRSHAEYPSFTRFSKTNNFDEAVNLFKNGWDTMSKELETRLKAECKNIVPVKQHKNVLSVRGYQPVVPLYLAGIPQNMIEKQFVVKKQKVIEISKSISYPSTCKASEIIEESIKALVIVKKLEAQGYRIKLNIVLGLAEGAFKSSRGKKIICKVCIKKPNERMNVSKLSFPLVHPSMLRRLFFRYIEVDPEVTDKMSSNYGYPLLADELKNAFTGDIIIPDILNCKADDVNSIDELIAKS